MTQGVWIMTDEGEFVLQEPYKTQLEEAKLHATLGWREGLIGYLEPRTIYTREELHSELLRRVDEGLDPFEMLDEFVLEALDSDLLARK